MPMGNRWGKAKVNSLGINLVICTLALMFVQFSFQPFSEGHVWKKITLNPALSSELNSLLEATDKLQSACYSQNEVQIEMSTKRVIEHIDSTAKKSGLAELQSTHLVKVLEAARRKLVMSQNLKGPQRKESFKGAFNDIVQISQIYKLKTYKIFFCSKDKSLWLQSERSPKNPVNPKRFGKCGQLVR